MAIGKRKYKCSKKLSWDKAIVLVFLLGSIVGFLLTFVFIDPILGKFTGAIVVQNGQLNQIDEQQKGNPNYGALSGKMTFIINSSSGTIISSDAGSAYTLYFSMHNVENWNLVKNDTQLYSGLLTGVDADGISSTCTSNDYTTLRRYYDSDNDNTVDPQEFYIYTIITDSNGCFAVKLPPGSYDIYG